MKSIGMILAVVIMSGIYGPSPRRVAEEKLGVLVVVNVRGIDNADIGYLSKQGPSGPIERNIGESTTLVGIVDGDTFYSFVDFGTIETPPNHVLTGVNISGRVVSLSAPASLVFVHGNDDGDPVQTNSNTSLFTECASAPDFGHELVGNTQWYNYDFSFDLTDQIYLRHMQQIIRDVPNPQPGDGHFTLYFRASEPGAMFVIERESIGLTLTATFAEMEEPF